MEETRAMESNSVDLIHTSIPFGNHYEYSANYNDFGHNQDTERFFEQILEKFRRQADKQRGA